MTNAELIDLFRNVERSNHPVCNGCPMKYTCDKNQITRCLFGTAADVLEAADKRIAELKESNKMLKNTIDADKGVMLDRLRFLEAQLPKDGEWMKSVRWYYQQPTRSVATTDGTTFMCRSTGKLCPNATEYGYCKQTVCNNSGEWMKGKQEGER